MDAKSNDQILLRGLAINDSKAIEMIYKEHFKVVQSFIVNNNGTYDDARDIFQEAVIALYEKVKVGNFQLTSQLQTFLFAICKRLWLKRLNKVGNYSISIEDSNDASLIADDEDADLLRSKDAAFEVMEKSLNSMGDPCRSLLKAFYVERKDMTEIARSFGYTNAENAKNQKYKCLMRLKKLFFTQFDNG